MGHKIEIHGSSLNRLSKVKGANVLDIQIRNSICVTYITDRVTRWGTASLHNQFPTCLETSISIRANKALSGKN